MSEPGTKIGTHIAMAKLPDWVRKEATGRLLYRRAYPVALRPFLDKPGQRELKVTLGARHELNDQAWKTYSAAKKRFVREVERAEAALELQSKQAAGTVDRLTPDMIQFLAGDWKDDQLVLDEEVRWLPRSRERKIAARENVRADIAAYLAESTELKALGDIETIMEHWGQEAVEHAGRHGVYIDVDAPGFLPYVQAFHDAQMEAWDIMLRRTTGEAVPTPPMPARPAEAQTKKVARDVSALMKSYRTAKWDAWSQSSRTAIVPVYRLLTDTIADRDVRSITREDARSLLDLVQQLPSGLGRRKELKDLPVPAAVDKGRELGIPTISPGTINLGYLAHLSALFAWAEVEEWADKNPFKGLSVHDPVAERDKRSSFTTDQLGKLFSSFPWRSPLAAESAKPGRFWVPLIALFSGMRLGEASGLRLMDIESRESIPAFIIRPYPGRSLKNEESRREVPVHPELIRLGFMAFVAERRAKCRADELIFPDGKANVRGQWGAKLGEWFVAHLKSLDVTGTKVDMHSFRHSFEDRLRSTKLHGTPIGLRIAGRKHPGSASIYGDGFSMADRLEALQKITFPGLNLDHLKP